MENNCRDYEKFECDYDSIQGGLKLDYASLFGDSKSVFPSAQNNVSAKEILGSFQIVGNDSKDTCFTSAEKATAKGDGNSSERSEYTKSFEGQSCPDDNATKYKIESNDSGYKVKITDANQKQFKMVLNDELMSKTENGVSSLQILDKDGKEIGKLNGYPSQTYKYITNDGTALEKEVIQAKLDKKTNELEIKFKDGTKWVYGPEGSAVMYDSKDRPTKVINADGDTFEYTYENAKYPDKPSMIRIFGHGGKSENMVKFQFDPSTEKYKSYTGKDDKPCESSMTVSLGVGAAAGGEGAQLGVGAGISFPVNKYQEITINSKGEPTIHSEKRVAEDHETVSVLKNDGTSVITSTDDNFWRETLKLGKTLVESPLGLWPAISLVTPPNYYSQTNVHNFGRNGVVIPWLKQPKY